MIFCERLNQYIEELSCTGKELAQNSGLSETVISRYRKGERVPSADGPQLQKLAEGIMRTAEEKGIRDLDKEEILRILYESLVQEGTSVTFLNEKLDKLIHELNLNVSKMAAALHYDASYISKVRTGKRNPSDPAGFAAGISGYIVSHFSDERGRKHVASLIGCNERELEEKEVYLERLKGWMNSGTLKTIDYASGFLQKVDEFDLNQYIRAIHFDTLKVPKVPFQLPVSRHYYGLKEMREGELEFLKNTVLSKSMEPLYLCSDMPVEDMAEDEDFARKYMFGLAMVLKRGIHIHIIHDVERPMKDMMLGLENWIPLYMTGQISPYYLKGTQNQIYAHLHYSSGTVAMTGDCISGHHDLAHYYLTNNKEETAICRKNMEFLLKKARPLMNIYREEHKKELFVFLNSETECEGRRRRILAAPPLFAISQDLLAEILKRNQIEESKQHLIMEHLKNQKDRMMKILCHSMVQDELPMISKEEYDSHPIFLSVAEYFFERDIQLSYEEYCACIEAAMSYDAGHENYQFRLTKVRGFRNIQVTCFEGKWCMVSKNKAPAIHFVIHHPKLRLALENVRLPIIDDYGSGEKNE